MLKKIDDWFPEAETVPIILQNAICELGYSAQKSPIASDLKKKRWLETERGKNHRDRFSLMRLSWNKVSPTIQKTATGSTGAMHPDEPRELYAEELKRIGSFPDLFVFCGCWENVLNRIGNSVPPLFMRSIARNIKSMLETGVPIRNDGKLRKIDDYPAYLESCWLEHLQEKPDNAPTVISTFAGCGGSSLGYSMAGFRELLAVEWDDNAVQTFNLNFPGVPVYHGDIAKLSVEKVLEMTGLKPGELDIFDGSPPCQGFSTAGKRQLDDPRNQLFREYVRLLRGLRPKVFVMENVSGMVKGVMKLVFAEILKELKASGYKVSARLLNAMYFGVPQSRQRMIFIGVRDDLEIEPSHPGAESVPETVFRAFVGVRNIKDNIKISQPVIDRWHRTAPGNSMWNFGAGQVKLSPDKPCPAFTKVGDASYSMFHYEEPRPVSIEEMQRLQSFPDDFIFSGGYKNCKDRIGNSVPPLFMRSIARHIRAHILDNLGNIPQ